MTASVREATREMLLAAALRLAPLLDRLVFVGGATTGLFLSDPAAPDIRPTKDVDVIVEVASRIEYHRLEVEIRGLGLYQEAVEDWPICRWTDGQVIVDFMPTDEEIPGFGNRWYADAMRASQAIALAEEIEIRVVTAPYFVGTKLEALAGRGQGDFLASPDLEDLVAIIDGRPELVEEIARATPELRDYIADAVRILLDDEEFLVALPGHLVLDGGSRGREEIVRHRLMALVKTGSH